MNNLCKRHAQIEKIDAESSTEDFAFHYESQSNSMADCERIKSHKGDLTMNKFVLKNK